VNKQTEETAAVSMAVPLDDVACGPPRPPDHVLGGLWKILELGRACAFYHSAPVEDTLVGRRAEVWMVPQLLVPSPEELERLRERAVLLRAVRHEGMRRVIDAGVDGDIAWIVVEPLLGGETLAQRIASHTGVTEQDIGELAGRLAAPLDAAHQAGLVHGLLRPSDVTFCADRVVIDGVGLWQALSPHAVSAMLRGEGRYLAPEVRAGEPATARSDVYSVGVLLAELAVGAHGETALGADLRVRLLRAYPLLGHALDGALALHPLERLPSVKELADDIDEVCGTGERIPEITVIEPREAILERARLHDEEEGSDTDRFAPLPSPRQSILGQMIAPLLSGGVAPSAIEFRPIATVPMTTPEGLRPRARSSPNEETGSSSSSWPTEDSILAPLPREAPSGAATTSMGVPLDEPFNSRLAHGTGPHPRPTTENLRARELVRDHDSGRQTLPLREVGNAQIKTETSLAGIDVSSTAVTAERLRSRDASGAITTSFAPVLGQLSMDSFTHEPVPRTAVVSSTRVVPWRTHVLVVAALSICTGIASWGATLLVVGTRRTEAREASTASATPATPAAQASRPKPPATAPAPLPKVLLAPTKITVPGPAPEVPAAAPAAPEPCPAAMALVNAANPYCIDRFEFPGEGRTPRTNVTREEAERACVNAGRRLCTAKEWERACRGVRGASYPYGAMYHPDLCRVRLGAPPGPSGAMITCQSASGAYDMSGNAAEWAQSGPPRGASSAGSQDGRCSRPVPMPDLGHATDVGFRCCADPRP
jgi:serine/threonine protein kinase